ncbi:MAG: Swt1 family HEPN domain-containing protein [Erythrobacter sp.]
MQILDDLKSIEEARSINLGLAPNKVKTRKSSEYEQFEAELRQEASRMSEFYEVFYCLENSIRKLVKGIMIEAEGADWWLSERVDETKIRNEARKRHEKELKSGITPRSDQMIDYTTFGELSQLITDNWDIFDPVFSSKTAVSNITNQLNLLRGPIAHCNPTDGLEQDRLNLAVRSWFKLMS